MKLRNTLLAAGSVLLMSAGTVSATENTQSTSMWVKESVAAPTHATVKVTSEMGDVRIRTWNKDKVAVRSEAVHGTIVVDASSENGVVMVDARSFGPVTATTAAVHVIYVPAHATLLLGDISGDVTIEDPNNSLTVEHVAPRAQHPESMLPTSF